jgi:hypothetical protein
MFAIVLFVHIRCFGGRAHTRVNTFVGFVEDRHGNGEIVNQEMAAIFLLNHERKLLNLLLQWQHVIVTKTPWV